MNAKIRSLSTILLTVCMLLSGMHFAAFAENEPATPTDLAPVEGETQEMPAGDETGDKDETGEETAPGEEIIPELHFGPNGLRGTLKAGEEYRAVLHPEYSWNILVTLALTPVDGRTDEEGVQVLFNGEKKNLVRIEEGNAEDSGIALRFEAYAAKDSEYIISVTAPFDADLVLTAVKRPEPEKEPGPEKEPEPEDGNDDGGDSEEPADAEKTGGEEPEVKEDAEKPAEAGEAEGGEPAESGEQTADGNGEETGEAGEAVEKAEPVNEPAKNEPATPTDLAPAEETRSQSANGTAKTETGKKEKKEKKAEEDKETLPTAEELLALGYYGSQVAMSTGADIFESMEEGAEPAAHLEPGEELWLRPTGDEAWAELYRADEKAPAQYIRWDDVIINRKPDPEEGDGEEEEEPLPARSIEITTTMADMDYVPIGAEITMTAELINFREDDICTFQWQYLDTETETYTDIDGANELIYRYQVTLENFYNTWRLVVLIANAG